MQKYVQRGLNKSFPGEIEVWNPDLEMKNIPEWFTDRCKIKNIEDSSGNYLLDYIKNNRGGYEFKTSDGKGILVSTSQAGDLVCFDGKSKIFSLRPKQLSLLYKKEEL